jgi:arginyl-tRNA synthetase
MKFYLLRVEPKKKMIFNPEESIDFHGFTGPFIQYTYARIKSILRKEKLFHTEEKHQLLFPLEKEVIFNLEQFPQIIEDAGKELSPATLANYLFHLAKTFNSFYSEHSIANAETNEKKSLRLQMANMTSIVLSSGMQLLGIQMPERM